MYSTCRWKLQWIRRTWQGIDKSLIVFGGGVATKSQKQELYMILILEED